MGLWPLTIAVILPSGGDCIKPAGDILRRCLKRETAVKLSNRRCSQYIWQARNWRLKTVDQLHTRRGELLLREKAKAEKPLEDREGKTEIGFAFKLILGHIVSGPPTPLSVCIFLRYSSYGYSIFSPLQL